MGKLKQFLSGLQHLWGQLPPRWIYALRLAVILLIIIASFYLAFQGIGIGDVVTSMERLNLWVMLPAVIIFWLSYGGRVFSVAIALYAIPAALEQGSLYAVYRLLSQQYHAPADG